MFNKNKRIKELEEQLKKIGEGDVDLFFKHFKETTNELTKYKQENKELKERIKEYETRLEGVKTLDELKKHYENLFKITNKIQSATSHLSNEVNN